MVAFLASMGACAQIGPYVLGSWVREVDKAKRRELPTTAPTSARTRTLRVGKQGRDDWTNRTVCTPTRGLGM